MFLLIPFLLGAGGTGYWWWSTEKEKEKESTFTEDLFAILKPVLLVLLVLLLLRWLYVKSSPATQAPPA